MATTRHNALTDRWDNIEWEDRSRLTYVLHAFPMAANNELRFDFEVIGPDGPEATLCTNLTPRTAAEIRQRLTDYLDFMSDKAVI